MKEISFQFKIFDTSVQFYHYETYNNAVKNLSIEKLGNRPVEQNFI